MARILPAALKAALSGKTAKAGAALLTGSTALNGRMVMINTPESSAIAKIGYNPLTQELFIKFKKTKSYPLYVFGGIREQTAVDFMRAGSKGDYYHTNIKDNKSFSVGKPLGSFRLGAIGRRVRNLFNRK